MTIKQAIKVLERANKWRRGGKGKQPDPKEFGEAIDVAIVMLENKAAGSRMDGKHIDIEYVREINKGLYEVKKI